MPFNNFFWLYNLKYCEFIKAVWRKYDISTLKMYNMDVNILDTKTIE